MIENSNQIDRKRKFVDSLKWTDWRSQEQLDPEVVQPRLKSPLCGFWVGCSFIDSLLIVMRWLPHPCVPVLLFHIQQRRTFLSLTMIQNLGFYSYWTSLGNVNQPWVTYVTRTVGLYELALTMLAPWKESYDKPWQCIKKQRHHFADKGPSSQSYGFCSSHVWLWELNRREV